MSKIYIAGPMRGIEEFNFPEFFKAQELLEGFGWDVLNPAQNDVDNGIEWQGTTGHEALEGFDLGEALRWDLGAVIDSDAIYLLTGWQDSTGAKIEKALAEALGKQMIHQYSTEPPIPPDRQGSACAVRKPGGKREGFSAGGIIKPEHIQANIHDVTRVDLTNMQQRIALNRLAKLNADLPLPSGKGASALVGGEIRTTSSTGGEKGVKSARFDLIPIDALTALAEHYGVGALKYDDNQWRKGYEWSKSYAAMQRHLTAWWGGEDIDEETGSSHLAAAAWHCFTLLTFIKEHPGHDDRFKL